MLNKIRAALGGTVAGKRIAVLGLAFKAGTDDVRDSPALTIIPVLRGEGAEIVAYDPVASKNAKVLLGNGALGFVTTLADAVSGADAAVILTEWPEFRKADWPRLARTMPRPLLIDLRNMFTLAHAAALGLDYISLGRQAILAEGTHEGQ